jgi:diguanylate cyclase (GGDEF)-like protein
MSTEAATQLLLMTVEAIAVCGLLLWFFHLRDRFGYSLLYVTLGAFQYLQTLMAATLYIEIAPGITVSPGSTILFTATLFAVLLVYIREDAAQSRSLIVGVVAANLTLSLVVMLATLQLNSELLVGSGYASDQLLNWSASAFAVGTATLIIDVVLIIVLYEFFFRLLPRSLFLRIVAAMLVIVSIDTVLFVTASFHGQDNYKQVLVSGLIGKSAVAIIYSVMLTAYLLLTRRMGQKVNDLEEPVRDIFHILTYKQRFQLLEEELKRDSLSGLFNRRFFDENLRRELERAKRLQHSLNLVLIDIDHFKSINDNFGHQVGDEAIVALAESMQLAFRSADILCRYGGEEFVAIMPDSSVEAAFGATRRLQSTYRKTCADSGLQCGDDITFTAGIANYPADGNTEEGLIRLADQRLYKGKNRGRNQVTIDTAVMRTISID